MKPFSRAVVVLLLVFGVGGCAGLRTASSDGPLFRDDFTELKPCWQIATGNWAVHEGLLRGSGAGGQVDAWIYAGDPSWKNYSLSVTAYLESGNAELVLRSRGHWKDEYRVSLWSQTSVAYPNCYQIIKYQNGEGRF